MNYLYVFGMLLVVFNTGASAAGNLGRSAMECISDSRDKDDVIFKNRCDYKVFVVWCGDMKYSKKKCGDGPQGNNFYTHSSNIGPGGQTWARGIKEFKYAACEGGIGFGKDEIKDSPDGSFTCIPSKSSAGNKAEQQKQQDQKRSSDRFTDKTVRQTEQSKNLPQDIQQPQVIISASPERCAPGYSPARHANGTFIVTPPTALCIKNEQHIDGQDDMRDRKVSVSDETLGQRNPLGNANDPEWADLYCNQPGTIHNGSIPCIEPKCHPSQIKSKGKCIAAPTISCIKPSVFQNGRCVSPASASGTTGTSSGSVSQDKDAAKCIVIKTIPSSGGSSSHQTITNTCKEKIGIIYCHTPSSMPDTRDTECGHNGRYFQQFSTMNPGQIKENKYSMPIDATIRYGACFGGESKIKQTTNGDYICR